MDANQLGKAVLDVVNSALEQARDAGEPDMERSVHVEARGVSISVVTFSAEHLVMKGEGA